MRRQIPLAQQVVVGVAVEAHGELPLIFRVFASLEGGNEGGRNIMLSLSLS
jgi:hypothetical protein